MMIISVGVWRGWPLRDIRLGRRPPSIFWISPCVNGKSPESRHLQFNTDQSFLLELLVYNPQHRRKRWQLEHMMIDDVSDIASFYNSDPEREHRRLEEHQLEYEL